jgi:LPXTG-motif cell wall-anchored protein
MIILNEAVLLGIAAVVTSLSGLVWSFRRKK